MVKMNLLRFRSIISKSTEKIQKKRKRRKTVCYVLNLCLLFVIVRRNLNEKQKIINGKQKNHHREL